MSWAAPLGGSPDATSCPPALQAAFLAGVKAKKLLVEAARHFVQVSMHVPNPRQHVLLNPGEHVLREP